MSTATDNGRVALPLPWSREAERDVKKQTRTFGDALADYKTSIQNRFKGADFDRFSRDLNGVQQQGTGGDYHYKDEIRFYRLIEVARDIDRDDMTASQGLDRLCVNVLQEGFRYKPETGDDEVDGYLKDKWKAYSESPESVDLQQERDFDQLSWSILRAELLDGDQLINPLDTGDFQTIEAHLMRTPRGNLSGEEQRLTVHGVQLDWARRRQRYHIARDDVPMQEGANYSRNDYTSLEAFDEDGNRNAFHIKHNFKRTASQTRGVTIHAPIIHAIGLLDDIQFAKLVQQQSVSSWVAQIQRELGGEYPDEEAFDQNQMENLCRPGQLTTIDDLSAGMIYKGMPGETLNGFSPNVPNPTYIDHAKQVMEVIGTNLYLPYVVLMMDASSTNFSGWRGALDQAKMLWRFLQSNFKKSWHRPALLFKMRQWVTPGSVLFDPFLYQALLRGVDVFKHSWQCPAWPYVNPVDDVTASSLESQKLQNSPRRILSRRGLDYDEVICGELVQDNAALIMKCMEAAEALQDLFPGQSVSWEQVVAVPTPDNISQSTSQIINDDQNQQQSEPVADPSR